MQLEDIKEVLARLWLVDGGQWSSDPLYERKTNINL